MNELDACLLAALNDCNQRGGRMLSVIDLLEAGTLDLPLAAYLTATMQRGASLLVGASPGGAGKTTIMCALLNFLPPNTPIVVVDSPAVLRHLPAPPVCLLAHEIGAGPYYAYIWGETARAFFAATQSGCSIASNLHADTLDQTYDQLCGLNGVNPAHLRAVTLKVFISITGRTRRIASVYESDGSDDVLVWRSSGSTYFRTAPSRLVTPADEARMADALRVLQARRTRTLEDIRLHLSTVSTL